MIRRSALVAAVLLFGVVGHAQAQGVTYQNSATAGANAVTTVTIAAFNPGAGTNRVLVVGLSFGQGAPANVSVAYGGVPLTLIPGTSGTNGTQHAEMWYLVSPSSTAANIVASWTGNHEVVMGAVAFNGADQTTPVTNGAFATGSSATPSVTVTSDIGNMTMATEVDTSASLSLPTQTQRWLDTARTTINGGGTTANGAATVTHQWTAGGVTPWVMSGADIVAYVDPWVSYTPTVFKVGSFTKGTGGAPASQTITHNLGDTPKAIILWTSAQTAEVPAADHHYAEGFSDGTSSYSVATASDSGVATSNVSRRGAAKALTIIQWGEVLLAEADLTSWTSTQFTLNWTTNNASAYIIHYMIIGGSNVSAKAVNWTMPTATGNKAVTGIGFQPDLVLHAHVGYGLTAALPTTVASGQQSLGAMNAAGEQWALTSGATDAVSPTQTIRAQRTDAALIAITTQAAVSVSAKYVSMDASGFTLNFTAVPAASQGSDNAVHTRLADFDGDGRDDLFLYVAKTGTWTAQLSGTSRTVSGQWPPHMRALPGRLNNDRFADVLLYNGETGDWLQAINTGDGRFTTHQGVWAPNWLVDLADFDGDQVDDVLLHDADTGASFVCATVAEGHFACHAGDAVPFGLLEVIDSLGGRGANLFVYDATTGRWAIGVNDGHGAFAYTVGTWFPEWTVSRGDLDGDRRSDVVLVDPATGEWMLAATVARTSLQTPRGRWSESGRVAIVDLNGDGRGDFWSYDPLTGHWTSALQVAPGRFVSYASGLWRPGAQVASGDFNGDGRADLVLYDPATGVWLRLIGQGAGAGFAYESGTGIAGATIVGK